jgi:Domain of unknown function (DUF5666)
MHYGSLQLPHFARTALAAAALGTLLLTACGGGGGSDSTSAQSYVTGSISGFGSVIVNGVHYEETGSRVEDEDGHGHDDSDLKLGMVVEIEAGAVSDSGGVKTAKAASFTFSSLVRGPVESVGSDSLVVLGQTVNVTPSTVFEESLAGGMGAAALLTGAVVKVYGLLDATAGTYTATRIELEDDSESYRLRGLVGNYDATARTLTIGTAVIDISGLAVPAGLQAGSLVRIKLQTTKSASGAWVAVELKLGRGTPDNIGHTEIEGTVTDYTSPTSFSVDGLPVDASQAAFEDGTAGLSKGAHVEVEGAIVNGVLVASKVEVESEDEQDHEDFEIEGSVSAPDATAQTFVLRGVTVSYAGGTVVFEGGTAAQIVTNARVEVHGEIAGDGVTVNAKSIKFEP